MLDIAIYFYTFLIYLVINIIINTTISKYTTIGQHVWFGLFIFKATVKLHEWNIKEAWVRKFISLSYHKALSCRACHTFWLSILTGTLLTYIDREFDFVYVVIITITSLIAYDYKNKIDEEIR